MIQVHTLRASTLSRRQALAIVGASAGPWATRGHAQAALLPLQTTGLDHIGMTVPDQEATARFYGMIFDPQLFQERDPPPRFYVRVGTSYIAFGGLAANTQNREPRIDHFCNWSVITTPRRRGKLWMRPAFQWDKDQEAWLTIPTGCVCNYSAF